jgi:hypothetical protein
MYNISGQLKHTAHYKVYSMILNIEECRQMYVFIHNSVVYNLGGQHGM